MADGLNVFEVGREYSRVDIQDVLSVPPERRGGHWDTGYTEYSGEFYIFSNVGVAGRTGVDHLNRWVGDRLAWHAKARARLDQDQLRRMLAPLARVHLFHRARDRAPFVYAGLAKPGRVEDTVPVRVEWILEESSISVDVGRAAIVELLRGAGFSIDAAGVKTLRASLGSTVVYVKIDSDSHVLVIGPEWENAFTELVEIPGVTRAANRFFYHNSTMRAYPKRTNGGAPIPYGFDFGFETTLAARTFIELISRSRPGTGAIPHARTLVDPRTETEVTRAARLGQTRFRADLLERWKGRCGLTGISMPEILRASHIKPWRDCTDLERLDPDNGLLLAVHIDGLFDRYLISFSEDGDLLLSPSLATRTREVLGLWPGMRIEGLSFGNQAYLVNHRAVCIDRWGAE